jgi:hypothetical protein
MTHDEGMPLVKSADFRENGREKEVVSGEGMTLVDGKPLYHALLSDSSAPYVSADDAFKAKNRLQRVNELDPGAVLSCSGKTLQQAKHILETVEELDARKGAM